MQAPHWSRFPHYVWLRDAQQIGPEATVLNISRRQVAFYLGYMARGQASVRWHTCGREKRYVCPEGAVRFCPADGELHSFVAAHDPGNSFFTLIIPPLQLQEVAASEGCECPGEWHHEIVEADLVLRSCMQQLAAASQTEDGREDESARRLVLRLLQRQTGRIAKWFSDESTFDKKTLSHIVTYIDEHLKYGPTLADMGIVTGLSPSHFGRKFRQSIGLSLLRFVNLRRIQASFSMLRNESLSLAHVATELGFASQSHFTQLFSQSTGISPAKYRKQLRPCVSGYRGRTSPRASPSPPPAA